MNAPGTLEPTVLARIMCLVLSLIPLIVSFILIRGLAYGDVDLYKHHLHLAQRLPLLLGTLPWTNACRYSWAPYYGSAALNRAAETLPVYKLFTPIPLILLSAAVGLHLSQTCMRMVD